MEYFITTIATLITVALTLLTLLVLAVTIIKAMLARKYSSENEWENGNRP
jgi:hypothetical protein